MNENFFFTSIWRRYQLFLRRGRGGEGKTTPVQSDNERFLQQTIQLCVYFVYKLKLGVRNCYLV